MKHAIDKKDVVKISVTVKNGNVMLSNGRGFFLTAAQMTPDTIVLAMLYQTLQTQLEAWRNASDNFKIELQIHEAID